MRRALAALAAVGVLAGCGGGGGHQLVGLTRDPEPQVDGTPMPDVSAGGKPFDIRGPKDGLLVVYFGYTNCPDVCPTTLSDLKVALGDIGDDAARVDTAMVTIDPERDIPVLAKYVQSFIPGAHALATDDQDTLQAVAGAFGVSYEVTTSPTGEVQVAHSSYLFAVDDTGKLVITWPVSADAKTTTSSKDLAADLRLLLRQGTPTSA
jgi:protein SCO1